ncbi:hypothetical protein TRIUR3_07442 [Triticum urartu]|uniref:Plant antimicrobial peptide domain-containing protein n=1 Tax=Triticum urartu TaxID=4572 RepID=M7ZRQ0_TRIUA|nr:hypothetical protein TRIUR3_07442 [Triticum urartu]
MGFVHKGGVWCFLLLAGVLLAAAAAGAEQDDGAVVTAAPEVEEEVGRRVDGQGNDSCDIKCQHHQVPARKKQCVDECHSREHHHPSRASCETKCSHWQDPTRKEQCVQQCMRRGLSVDVGGSNAVDERPHAQEEEVARRACDWECRLSCQTKCKNWKDRTKHQECVRQCIRGSNSAVDEQLRGWEAVAGAIIEAV